jgi:hypothetical protein
MIARFIHSPIGRILRIVLGAAIVVYSIGQSLALSTFLLVLGTFIAVMGMAGVCPLERLVHVGGSTRR